MLLKQATLRPSSYPERAEIGADAHDWLDPKYAPRAHTDDLIIDPNKPSWADDVHIPFLNMLERKTIDRNGNVSNIAACTLYDFGTSRFLNPRGKTGITGRGMLGQWGANWAADVIVTKYDAADKLCILLCEKQLGDGVSDLCFPAGIVEPGELVPETLRRELCEEAVDDGAAVSQLFDSCKVGCVYAGHVDDWRNTDHAWMVTQAFHFHATPDIALRLNLNVKDKGEIKKSAWYVASEVTSMYASHKDWLDKVIAEREASRTSLFVAHDIPNGLVQPLVPHAYSTSKPHPPSPVASVDANTDVIVRLKRPRDD